MRENHETVCILAGAVSRYRRKRLTKFTDGLIDADSVVSLLHNQFVRRPATTASDGEEAIAWSSLVSSNSPS
jgi:hypothetical protein